MSGQVHTRSRWTRPRGSRSWAVVGAAALAASLAACGGGGPGGADGQVTLRVATWDAAEETARPPFLDLVDKFEEEHPDITIEHEAIPFSDIENKVLMQLQAGNAPDVVQLSGNYTFNLQASDALAPLDDYADDAYLDALTPEVRDIVTVDDELIAAPWAVQPVGLWYNKKLLAEAGLDPESPPTTVEELLDQLATVKQELPGVIPMGVDSTNRVFGLDVNWPWIRTFGAEPIADGGTDATSPEMADYLTFMRTLAEEDYTEVNQKIGYFRPIAAEDKVAFIWDQPILKAVVQQTSGVSDEEFYETWGVARLPVGDSGEPFSVAQDHALGILGSSENKDAAWTFIEWMTSSDAALAHVVENKGSLPPVREPGGKAQRLVESSPALQTWSEEVLPTTVRPPWGPEYGKAYSAVMVGVQQMMTSDQPVESVAEEMDAQLESALR